MPSKARPSRRRSPLPSAVTLQTVHATNFPIVALCWSSTGHYLAVAVQHGTVLLYVVHPSSSTNIYPPLRPVPFRTFRGHTADVLHLTFSPTHFLATAAMDRSVRLWHPNSTACLRHLAHPDMATCAAFNPADENLLLTAGCDGRARLWRLAEHAVVAQTDIGAVLTTTVFLTPHRAAVGTYDGRVLQWHPRPGSVEKDDTSVPRPLTDVILDSRRAQQRKARRPQFGSVRLASAVVHNDDARKRRTFVTADATRAFELRDDGVARKFKASGLKKGGIALGTSVSSDGRFVMMDAVGGVVRVMDCLAAEEPRKKDKEIRVGTVEIRAMTTANVASAAIAGEPVRKRCGRARVAGPRLMLAVGGDDGTLKIMEQQVPSV